MEAMSNPEKSDQAYWPAERERLLRSTSEFIERVEKGGGCEVDGQIFPAAVDLLKFLVEGHS